MRGSPLLRFILLTLALAATALGLMRVTALRDRGDAPRPNIEDEEPTSEPNSIPFRLVLSAPAASIEMNTGKPIRPASDQSIISGMLKLAPQNPHVELIIKWKQAALPGEHRFARLTLEAPGQESFTHVFDAPGDIDDFLELPISESKR